MPPGGGGGWAGVVVSVEARRPESVDERAQRSKRAALEMLWQPPRVCWRLPLGMLLVLVLMAGSATLLGVTGSITYFMQTHRAVNIEQSVDDATSLAIWWLPQWILAGVLFLAGVVVFIGACISQARVKYTPRDFFRVLWYRPPASAPAKTTGQKNAPPYTGADTNANADAGVSAIPTMDQDAGMDSTDAGVSTDDV